MKKATVITKYKLGHTIKSEWLPDELFCPECGSAGSVWTENDAGDYYDGPDYVCLKCNSVFTIGGPFEADYTRIQAIEQIRRQHGSKDQAR